MDITTRLDDGLHLAIEYDGTYWHADKIDLDTEKSRDLLAAGYLLARLREHPLPSLSIADDRYVEFTVYSTAPDDYAVLTAVSALASAKSAPESLSLAAGVLGVSMSNHLPCAVDT